MGVKSGEKRGYEPEIGEFRNVKFKKARSGIKESGREERKEGMSKESRN